MEHGDKNLYGHFGFFSATQVLVKCHRQCERISDELRINYAGSWLNISNLTPDLNVLRDSRSTSD